MDLIIELIVWLLRSLFGEPESPANMKRTPGPQAKGKRGPYNYGDEGGRAPKTLEQILEEVRLEAARKRGVESAPPPPKPVQSQQPRKSRKPLLAEPLGAPEKPAFRSSFDAEPAPAETGAAQPEQTEVQALAPIQASEELAKTLSLRKLDTLHQRHNQETEPAVPMDQAKKGRKKPRQRIEQTPPKDAGTPFALVRAIRHAPLESKRTAAREAVILAEVFGPPRSRRRLAPGRRMF